MTRAMLVTVLYRLDGQKEPTGANPFTDVEPDSWYTEAVIWAVENEIVLGMGDGTFAPEAEITREQMAAILYRYAAYRGDDMTTDADLAAFPDEERVSAYAREALAWAVGPRPYQRCCAERRELARAAGGCDPRAGGNDPHALPEAEISNDNAQRRSSGRRCCR